MSGTELHHRSHVWEPDLNLLAQNLLSYLTKTKKARFIELDRERLEEVYKSYYSAMTEFKRSIYGAAADNHNIDRHKIIALYIKAVLENKPFQVKPPINKGVFRAELLANEFFCLCLTETVIKGWEESLEKKYSEKKHLNIPILEKGWFFILLHQYSKYPKTFHVLSLSQIIYYIEKCFLESY
jgi:hypothetical protein